MDLSAQNVFGLLIRSRLLSLADAKVMYERWQGEARDDAANADRFTQWMAANGYVTEYQATLLSRGHADHFFLGEFKILDRVGRGRMAGVYKAVHHLGLVVAIKVLPPSRAKDPQMLGRFQREARLALRLEHPNIVRALQMGEADELHYLVMEYLEGETLDEVIGRRKKLPAVEAIRLVHQALLGLQHMHEQGMIHRDLKPSNMMLVPAPAPGPEENTLNATLKILDIGLGRALYDDTVSAKDMDQLTSEGALLGTPDYMSPEQARDARSIDIRSDVYSLGCVLYHLLVGQPPFPDTNIINQMIRHASETPRPLREFDPGLPDVLQQIINAMTAKDPNQRYPTPERAAQTLRIFLHSEAAPARPPEAERPRMPETAPPTRPYLDWLDTETVTTGQAPVPSPPEPVAAPSAPHAEERPAPALAARPEAAPALCAAPVRPPERARRPGTKSTQVPLALPSVSQTPSASDPFDVELAPVGAPRKPVPLPGEGLNLSRRDLLMLGIGAGGVVFAVFLGWLLAQLFRRKPKAAEPADVEPVAPNPDS